VAHVVRTAGRVGLRVAVQATGHGADAGLQDAVLVHTEALQECQVHAQGWARVGAGCAGAPWWTPPRRSA
jgi:hypothetical protein